MNLERSENGSFKNEWITLDADSDIHVGSKEIKTYAYTFQGKGYWVQELLKEKGAVEMDVIVYWHDAEKADLKRLVKFEKIPSDTQDFGNRFSAVAIPAMYLPECWDLLVPGD